MQERSVDPVLDKLIKEYLFWKPTMDSGATPHITIEVRGWMPEQQRVSSHAHRDAKKVAN